MNILRNISMNIINEKMIILAKLRTYIKYVLPKNLKMSAQYAYSEKYFNEYYK